MMPYIMKIPPQFFRLVVVQVLGVIGRIDIHISLQQNGDFKAGILSDRELASTI